MLISARKAHRNSCGKHQFYLQVMQIDKEIRCKSKEGESSTKYYVNENLDEKWKHKLVKRLISKGYEATFINEDILLISWKIKSSH